MLAGLAGHGAAALERLEAGFADLGRVARFARGHLEFAPRPDDVFLVSYPRSGTTWMQMVLYQLTTEGRMDFDHIGQKVPWYERSLAVGAARAADFEDLPAPRVFKSHLLPRWLPGPARFIYIQRDGLDVAMSYYHLYKSHLGYRGRVDDFFERFLAGRVQYKSWFAHVAAWERLRTEPGVLFVRFEDLKRAPAEQIERIAAFLGIALDAKRRARVLERSTLAFMKAHQDKFDHLTALMLENGWRRGAFIRDGAVGGWRRRLAPGQADRFRARSEAGTKPADGLWDLPAFLH